MKQDKIQDNLTYFFDLIPGKLTIENKTVIIDDILNFPDIGKMFAFCHIVNQVGRKVYFQKQDISIGNESEGTRLKAISYFVSVGRDTVRLR